MKWYVEYKWETSKGEFCDCLEFDTEEGARADIEWEKDDGRLVDYHLYVSKGSGKEFVE